LPEKYEQIMQSHKKDYIFDVDQEEKPEASMQENHDGSYKSNDVKFHESRHY
jgi:hypothetical protein